MTSEQTNAAVLLVSADLFLGSRIQGAVTAGGCSLIVASSGSAAVARLTEGVYALVLIDLETPGLDPGEVVRVANENSPTTTVAYGPHVREPQLAAAREAGCTEVLSRGKFDATINELLSRFLVPGD